MFQGRYGWLIDYRFVQNLWQTSTFQFSSNIWLEDLGSHAIARNQTEQICREAAPDLQSERRSSTRLDVSAEADGSGMLRFEATKVLLAGKFEDADTLVAGVGTTSGGCRVRAVFQKEPGLICCEGLDRDQDVELQVQECFSPTECRMLWRQSDCVREVAVVAQNQNTSRCVRVSDLSSDGGSGVVYCGDGDD